MTLAELWQRWAAELPLWEASLELDPPEPERIDRAAWEMARAMLRGQAHREDFDGTEQPPAEPRSETELRAEAEKIARSWPQRQP